MFKIRGDYAGRETTVTWENGKFSPDYVQERAEIEVQLLRSQGIAEIRYGMYAMPLSLDDEMAAIAVLKRFMNGVQSLEMDRSNPPPPDLGIDF
jgi:hypothetical protein